MPMVVSGWVFAAVACGVVVGSDAHFVVRDEGAEISSGLRIRETYGFSASTAVVWEIEEVDRDGRTVGMPTPRTRFRPYDVQRRLLARRRGAPRLRAALRHLEWAGLALFALACFAPFLGLFALLSRRFAPVLGQVRMLVAALAPLAALEWFGFAVNAKELGDPLAAGAAWSMSATTATWWARVAWGYLAFAAAIAWWPAPRPREAPPFDPEVFE